jgi:hypothetical protein
MNCHHLQLLVCYWMRILNRYNELFYLLLNDFELKNLFSNPKASAPKTTCAMPISFTNPFPHTIQMGSGIGLTTIIITPPSIIMMIISTLNKFLKFMIFSFLLITYSIQFSVSLFDFHCNDFTKLDQ